MARSVKKSDKLPICFRLIGTDVLGDSSGFFGGNSGLAHKIQQGCLAMIHVSEYDYNRGSMFGLKYYIIFFLSIIDAQAFCYT